MSSKTNQTKTAKPLFSVSFADGSRFILPEKWEDVFVDYYGANPAEHVALAERLQFVTSKYIEHRAWPSKFDGIGLEEESEIGSIYDNPDYYWEYWDDWQDGSRTWEEKIITTPTWAEVAEAVLYQTIRSGLMQKALNELAKKEGSKAPRVVTSEEFLQELKNRIT